MRESERVMELLARVENEADDEFTRLKQRFAADGVKVSKGQLELIKRVHRLAFVAGFFACGKKGI